jgi:hypothetical protein
MSDTPQNVDGITLPCCACNGEVTFATNTERPTFLHTMPPCERFNSTDHPEQVVQYLRDCGAWVQPS